MKTIISADVNRKTIISDDGFRWAYSFEHYPNGNRRCQPVVEWCCKKLVNGKPVFVKSFVSEKDAYEHVRN